MVKNIKVMKKYKTKRAKTFIKKKKRFLFSPKLPYDKNYAAQYTVNGLQTTALKTLVAKLLRSCLFYRSEQISNIFRRTTHIANN